MYMYMYMYMYIQDPTPHRRAPRQGYQAPAPTMTIILYYNVLYDIRYHTT